MQKGDGDKKQYASLAPGQLIESITLEEALKLFALPRIVGQFDGTDIICTNGRFGPYIAFDGNNYKLPKNVTPADLTLEECIDIVNKQKENVKTPAKRQYTKKK